MESLVSLFRPDLALILAMGPSYLRIIWWCKVIDKASRTCFVLVCWTCTFSMIDKVRPFRLT
ncbi:hypothetical protein Lalb_Chr16g0387001 [Lupinus albus]|uniref:Uncharacterized protein n=1 Tax=Lupinus albus TaxID=3870 RepID=A0A6A4P9S0_LUPAL|nr:hypothetical protein Lalb_Chr16g0387001 [Lupinus albus]